MSNIRDYADDPVGDEEALEWLSKVESMLNEYCTTNHDEAVLARLRELVQDYFYT